LQLLQLDRQRLRWLAVDEALGQRLPARAPHRRGQHLFGFFLELVEDLGWRVSAVRQLRAIDYDRATTTSTPNGRIRKAGEFDPKDYRDEYRARVMELIERKASGKTVRFRKPAPARQRHDLTAALRASLARERKIA